jgi:endonuclease III
MYLKRQIWEIVDRKPLTAEQKKANKEFEEQIKALESSIKINEQDLEHKLRLIGNYNERIEMLKAKIVEGI